MRYMSQQPRGVAYPFWERVSRERAALGWSWSELHRTTGVARSTISKWKIQPRPPQPATVVAVADALAIPVAEALTLAGVVPDEEETPEMRLALRRLAEARKGEEERGDAS